MYLKEAKDLYYENYKLLIKKKSMPQTDGMIYHVLGWKNQYCQNDYTTQGNLYIKCNSYQITKGIFHRTRTKKFFNLYGKTKDPTESKQP